MSQLLQERYEGEIDSKLFSAKSILYFLGGLNLLGVGLLYFTLFDQEVNAVLYVSMFAVVLFFVFGYLINRQNKGLILVAMGLCLLFFILALLSFNLLGIVIYGVASYNLWKAHLAVKDLTTPSMNPDILDEEI